jgi:hypothetical protein
MPRTTTFLALLLAVGAYAAPTRAAEPVTPEGWGITLSFPDNGELSLPGEPGMEDSDVAFLWQVVSDNPLEDPVYQIDGSTIEGDDPAPMSAEAFDAFYTQMVEDLGADEKFTVLGSVKDEQHAGRRWQAFDLREKQEGTDEQGKPTERSINYLSYFALDGEDLRLVNFYYEPTEDGTAPAGVQAIVAATLGS